MLMPSKHRKLSESAIGIAGIVLAALDQPRTPDELWLEVKSKALQYRIAKVTLDRLLFAVDFLFILGVIRIDEGVISREARSS